MYILLWQCSERCYLYNGRDKKRLRLGQRAAWATCLMWTSILDGSFSACTPRWAHTNIKSCRSTKFACSVTIVAYSKVDFMILSSNNYIILRISSFRAIPKVRYCQRTVPNNPQQAKWTLNEIEKNFQWDLSRVKEHSSEVRNIFC